MNALINSAFVTNENNGCWIKNVTVRCLTYVCCLAYLVVGRPTIKRNVEAGMWEWNGRECE